MERAQAGFLEVAVKTVVAHTVTYFIAGLLAFTLLDYRTLIYQTAAGSAMRPLDDPMLMAAPLLQPVRGLLFGIAFYVLREPIFGRKHGWLLMWFIMVAFGVLGTFGAPPGSLEGLIYTVVPVPVQLALLPEVVLQSLALSWLVFEWVNHRERRWIHWAMGVAFVVVLTLPALGLASLAAQ